MKKEVGEQLVFLVGRRAAKDTGRSGNAETKTTSREGMLMSCWANPSWKKGENVESEGKREETIRWQRKVPGFGQKWKGLLEKKNPLPIHQFLSNFHLLSLYGFRVFSFFAGGPTGLCSVIEAFGVNETAVLFEG